MKIKTDENIPTRVAVFLADRGHNVSTVRDEDLTGASDPVVFGAIVSEQRMLVTLDRGFGDIRAYPPGTSAGIVILRCSDQSAASVEAACRELLDTHEFDEFLGCTVIVQAGLIRVRRRDGS